MRRVLNLLGQGMRLGGLVGLISPWLPDPGNHAASDDLAGRDLVIWLASCAVMVMLGALLASRTEGTSR